jgi:hypothetical protein
VSEKNVPAETDPDADVANDPKVIDNFVDLGNKISV